MLSRIYGMFPGLTQADLDHAADPRSREIVVENQNYLAVPGLLQVESVFIQGAIIPAEAERPVWVKAPGREEESETTLMPMLSLDNHPEFGQVLYRSVLSNDGIWPIGAKAFVVGEWEGDENAPKKAKAKKPDDQES